MAGTRPSEWKGCTHRRWGFYLWSVATIQQGRHTKFVLNDTDSAKQRQGMHRANTNVNVGRQDSQYSTPLTFPPNLPLYVLWMFLPNPYWVSLKQIDFSAICCFYKAPTSSLRQCFVSEDGYNFPTPQLHLFRPTIYQPVMQVKLKLHADTLELLSVVIHSLPLLSWEHEARQVLHKLSYPAPSWGQLTALNRAYRFWQPQLPLTLRFPNCVVTLRPLQHHTGSTTLKPFSSETAEVFNSSLQLCKRGMIYCQVFDYLQKQLHTAHLLNSSLSVEDIQELSFATI